MNTIKTYIHDGGRIGDGFGHEKLDCAVRAYAIAKQIPYSEAHQLFEKAGRKPRHTTDWNVYEKLGVIFQHSYTTIKQFLKDHPKGSFYVCKRGHAFAIRDGIVYDSVPLSGRIIIKKWFEVK